MQQRGSYRKSRSVHHPAHGFLYFSVWLGVQKKQRVLEEDKYAPGSRSRWKHVSARFPALYKALLAEPDGATRSAMLRSAVHASG